MMMNLFSIFDPSNSIYLSLNWLMLMISLFLFSMSFWKSFSRLEFIMHSLLKLIYMEFKIILKKELYNLIILMSLLILIMMTNFMGLFPYIFTSSSHMIYSLSFSLILWFMIMIYGFMKNYEYMFAHMLPLGTPKILMIFMILIESISNIIRPLTLSIRLSANMIAGHLLLTLMGSTGTNLFILFLIIMLIIQCMLMILEMSVALIQSYVFTILSTLYIKEVMYEKLLL